MLFKYVYLNLKKWKKYNTVSPFLYLHFLHYTHTRPSGSSRLLGVLWRTAVTTRRHTSFVLADCPYSSPVLPDSILFIAVSQLPRLDTVPWLCTSEELGLPHTHTLPIRWLSRTMEFRLDKHSWFSPDVNLSPSWACQWTVIMFPLPAQIFLLPTVNSHLAGSWHHWLDGCEFEQAPGIGDGQGSLVSVGSQRFGHYWATELNWMWPYQ